ncbi:MAG: glycosyltransferase [Leptolyngbya sp. SIO1E4]|nr:glycosyltransferase [Leptolyngbya sp. SIO1E4]
MKISVITPVFNAASTIEKTILSVINQPINSDLEYIIVDGGSTDGTQEVVNRYSDQISLFISEKDRGVYDAMNKGVDRATGDIVGIINADDWYNEGALKIVEDAFSQESSIDILYSPIENYLQGQHFNTFVPGALENLYIKFVLNHPSCFVKKDVYTAIGKFNLKYAIAADYDFILRAYVSGFKFSYTETPLASYSLDGMSGLGASLSIKLKQLNESRAISTANILKAKKTSTLSQQRKFYTLSFAKLLMTFPLKQLGLITPTRTNKIKQFYRKNFGKLAADKYGSW